MEYKLVAIDMDGTLLNKSKAVSSKTLNALTEARKKGVHIVLSTGRILKSAERYWNELELSSPIIACNGAVISDENGNVIYKNPIGGELAKNVVEIAVKNNVYFHFYNENTLFSNIYVKEVIDYYADRDWSINYEIFDNIDGLVKNNINIYKFLMLDNDFNKLRGLHNDLEKLNKIGLTKSGENNLEVMNTNVSKGMALDYLCEKLNTPRERVIAIGDNENDISMLQFAGLGVAMGNASDYVKSKADYVTLTNDEDGVANIIEKFIL